MAQTLISITLSGKVVYSDSAVALVEFAEEFALVECCFERVGAVFDGFP